jgi:type I restriction enzyme M protein|nr:MAG TPA: N-6 DNA Methylase [Caudoviricetes sp.]
MMELKELSEKVKSLFEAEDIDELPKRILNTVKDNDSEKYEDFCKIVKDLSIDWLQMIYQYYLADRKEKMQDYTPKSLALFMGKLIGDADVITDLCAGSGALTIQKWCMNNKQKFELYEFDENVIPFLLFNMAVRNIECTVYHADVLQQENFHTYKISRGEKYGKFREVAK